MEMAFADLVAWFQSTLEDLCVENLRATCVPVCRSQGVAQLVRGKGAVEIESLCLFTAKGLKHVELGLRFDTLRDHMESKRLPHGNDCTHDRNALGSPGISLTKVRSILRVLTGKRFR